MKKLLEVGGWGLIQNNPKTTKLYLQPKIHTEVNAGCPVISSMNCHTANISKYFDLPPSTHS